MNDLISVIIPVFNAEKSIGRCFNSIKSQQYQNLEIIVVDDGSVDHSLELCRIQAEEDKRFKIVHLDNRGVSFARNYGISVAKGKWIMFMDSDDFLLPDALKIMAKDISENSADIYCWNSCYSKNEELTEMGNFVPAEHLYDKNEIQKLMHGLYCKNGNEYYGDFFRAVWGKIYLAELVKKNFLKFPEDIKIGEDALFLLDCLFHADCVYVKNNFVYGYECSDDSVTGRYKKDFQKYQIDEYNAMKTRFEKYGLDVNKASIEFWHKGEKDYIKNELKLSKNILLISDRTFKWVNEHPEINRYLCMEDENDGIRSKIRTHMLKFNLKRLVSIVDVIILKKKCEMFDKAR